MRVTAAQMLPVVGSDVKYFRGEILEVSQVLAVFQGSILLTTHTARFRGPGYCLYLSISGFDTADTANTCSTLGFCIADTATTGSIPAVSIAHTVVLAVLNTLKYSQYAREYENTSVQGALVHRFDDSIHNFPRVCSVRYVPRRTAGIHRRYYRYRTLR